LEIYISQGSVATQLKCGGIFRNNFTKHFPQNVLVKKNENRLIFGEDMDTVCGLLFWRTLYIGQ